MHLIHSSLMLIALVAAQATAQTIAGHPPDRTTSNTAFGAALPDSALDALSGGADTTANDMRLSGTTAENSARQVTTGNNAISDGAFSAMSGIPVVIQNTGANVLIQNAVILNLRVN